MKIHVVSIERKCAIKRFTHQEKNYISLKLLCEIHHGLQELMQARTAVTYSSQISGEPWTVTLKYRNWVNTNSPPSFILIIRFSDTSPIPASPNPLLPVLTLSLLLPNPGDVNKADRWLLLEEPVCVCLCVYACAHVSETEKAGCVDEWVSEFYMDAMHLAAQGLLGFLFQTDISPKRW